MTKLESLKNELDELTMQEWTKENYAKMLKLSQQLDYYITLETIKINKLEEAKAPSMI